MCRDCDGDLAQDRQVRSGRWVEVVWKLGCVDVGV